MGEQEAAGEEKTMKDQIVFKRFFSICLIVLTLIGYTAAVSLCCGVWLDEMILYLVFTAMFGVLFVFFLEHKRNLGAIEHDRETDYAWVWMGLFLSSLLMLAGVFLPEFLKPVLAAAVCMSAFSKAEIALPVHVFYSVLLCLGMRATVYEFLLYGIFCVFGCILAEAVGERRFALWYNLILFCISVLLPAIFYYIANQQISYLILLYGAAEGAALVFLVFVFQKNIIAVREHALQKKYKKIMDESYFLAKELREFSIAEYAHAKKVSEVASYCAKVAGAKEQICAAAGFYYRIGIIEGDAIAKNGIRLLRKSCFPEDVIHIIEEYNGEMKKPSTSESAIVHMVDGLMKKLEVLKSRTTMSNDWNQDMVIYQTLNEYSASGIYDNSGLSMNRFLQIRECLVKSDHLLETERNTE